MKKIKQIGKVWIMLTLVIIPGVARALLVPPVGECVGGTCPSDGQYIDGIMYGCGRATECYCVNSDGEGINVPCGCFGDADCKTSGYGCINGQCAKCRSCTNCTSSNTWDSVATGYQRRTTKTCGCDGTCNTSYSYRCAPGYFGNSYNGTSGCTRCPTDGGVTGTSVAGTTARTGCYVGANTTGRDNSGAFEFTGNSYYCD